MKISERWLREWVDLKGDVKSIANQLTMLGLPVDKIATVAEEFTHVVIGEVMSVAPHPKADRLQCCQVDIGAAETLHIVCGAVNVRAGLKVAVAKVGACLPGSLKIKAAKLRGMLSEGMLCSNDELGLSQGIKERIIELPSDAPVGTDFRDYLDLDDTVIEIELTPNRGDCCSVRGIARDLAAANGVMPVNAAVVSQPVTIQDTFPLRVEASAACPRYLGRVLRDINSDVATPVWMSERLRRSDFRLVHPVVDILNYVMLETGQPMHAFDLDQLETGINVSFVKEKTCLTLLNEQVVELQPGHLVVADQQGVVALAGVMGGLHSSVTSATQHIFLESAFFYPAVIRRSASAYKLQTESAYRFERSVDYELPMRALERATELLLDIIGGKAGPVTEVVSESFLPKASSILLPVKEVERLLGIRIEEKHIETILTRLGLSLCSSKDGWQVTVPSYRSDIVGVADIVEEIARLYGYDRIVSQPMTGQVTMLEQPEQVQSESSIADSLVMLGYFEVITYSFISKEDQLLFNPSAQMLPLMNPMASNMSVMRSSLWPGLIKVAQHNYRRQILRAGLFEMGLTFRVEKKRCIEVPTLGVVLMGSVYPEQWGVKQRPVDFYDLKGDMEMLWGQDAFSLLDWRSAEHPALHPGQTARLYRNKKPVGYLGTLHPRLAQQFDLPAGIVCFEIELSAVQKGQLPSYQEVSKFPEIRRDIAVIVDSSLPVLDLKKYIQASASSLLSHVEVFDVYQDEKLMRKEKSVALGLTFQSPSRTLVDVEINEVIQSVVISLQREFKAKLRE